MSPLPGLTLTLLAWTLSLPLSKRFPHLPPLLPTCTLLIAYLLLTHTPLDHYTPGGDYLSFLLGPATVALALPMYNHAQRLKRALPALLLALTLSALLSILTATTTAYLMGAPKQLVLSLVPRSVTTPVAIEISRSLGGIPALSATISVLSGLYGTHLNLARRSAPVR